MYRKFVAVLVVVFLAGLACLAYPPCPAPAVKGEVTLIVDGDTIHVKILSVPPELSTTLPPGRIVRVRYIGIDAPEQGQPGFTEATEINRLLVYGRTVWLELDQTTFDGDGRLLAYVYLDEKGLFMVNMALVTSPLFKAYPFDNTPRYNECFRQADINPGICSTCEVKCIPAERAHEFIGQEIWVYGTVKSVYRTHYGRIFLNFNRPYPNQVFTVMIHERHTPDFDRAFGSRWERRLVEEIVCVFGKVTVYRYRGRDIPQILPTSPDQVRAEVLTVPCPAFCPCR